MKYNKRFSIVIPSYQSKKQLSNTLEALNRQIGISGDDFEVVVIDDGSTDGTGEVIKGIPKNYGFQYIYLERTPGSSRSKARNAGIMAAQGEIIVFLDADIIVKEDYISKVDDYFKVNRDILLIGFRVMLTEEVTHEELSGTNALKGEKFKINKFGKLELRHFLFEGSSYNSRCNMYPWIHVFSCNMAVSKELLDRSGFFDENFKGWGMEDVELGYRLYKCGAKIVISNKIEAFHQPHTPTGSSMSKEERDKEIDTNTIYFINKHPGAMDEPVPTILDFFRGAGVINFDVIREFEDVVAINFTDKSELDSVKSEILKNSEIEKKVIMVLDFVEDTDLDIWIQLLDGVKSFPRYLPMSKGKEMAIIPDSPRLAFYREWEEKLRIE